MERKNRLGSVPERPTIIIFSTAYLPLLGGAEIAVKGITDHVGDFNFVMLTGRHSRKVAKEEAIDNVWVYRLGFGTSLDKFFLPLLAFIKFFNIRKEISKPYMFWAVMISYGSLGALFLKYFFPSVPLLLTIQEGDAPEYILKGRLGLIRFFWKRLLANADYIQVISNYLKQLSEELGVTAPISVIPNGVDISAFQNPDPITPNDIRSELKIQEGELVVITVSRLTYKNAIDVLVQSMQFTRTKPTLVIVGDGKEREKISALRDSLGLKDRVHMALSRPNEDIPNYLSLAKVFVRPSRSEGLGISFLEAMAAGVPIIATSVGGIKDFLKDGETGLEIKVDDPKDLAEKIDKLLFDVTLRQRLIANGRKLVEEKYQWSNIALKMRSIFNSLLPK